jgi:DnaJ-class molecular chaperone
MIMILTKLSFWVHFYIVCLNFVECSRSYYDILGVPKTANDSDIKKAYRKLALKNHPDKGGKEEDFKEISTAYQVLGDSSQKEIYDTYGEAGLSGGGPSAANFQGTSDPFGAGGNPFQSYFSSSEGAPGGIGKFPFQNDGDGGVNIDLSSILKNMMGGNGASGFQRASHPSSNSYTKKVSCTLEELALGTTKKLKVKFGKNGPTGEKVYPIKIQMGWKTGTKITFPSKHGCPTMVFVIEQAPHKYLRRENNDLHYTCWISESQTKGGIVVKVPLPSKCVSLF